MSKAKTLVSRIAFVAIFFILLYAFGRTWHQIKASYLDANITVSAPFVSSSTADPELTRFETFLAKKSQMIEKDKEILFDRTDSEFKLLTDRVVLKTIEDAKKLVLKHQEAVKRLWAGEEILDKVSQLGKTIPIRECANPDLHMAWQDNMLLVNSKHLLEVDIRHNAASLVHELTHAVFDERLAKMSSFTQTEIVVQVLYCKDFRERFFFYNEILAYTNGDIFGDFIGAETGRLSVQIMRLNACAFVGYVTKIVADREKSDTKYRVDYISEGDSFECSGTPLMIRGPQKGQRFDMTNIHPEFLQAMNECRHD